MIQKTINSNVTPQEFAGLMQAVAETEALIASTINNEDTINIKETINNMIDFLQILKNDSSILINDNYFISAEKAGKMKESLTDMEKFGLRVDLNPTRMISSDTDNEKFWMNYIKDVDTSLRTRAKYSH